MTARKPGDNPAWYAVGPVFVIAIVEQVESSIFTIKCVGPNGIGTAAQQSGFTLREALEDAELTLRDLGWRMTPKGFEHAADSQKEGDGHSGDT